MLHTQGDNALHTPAGQSHRVGVTCEAETRDTEPAGKDYCHSWLLLILRNLKDDSVARIAG